MQLTLNTYGDVEKLHLKMLPFFYAMKGISLDNRPDLILEEKRLVSELLIRYGCVSLNFGVCEYQIRAIPQPNKLGTKYKIVEIFKLKFQ